MQKLKWMLSGGEEVSESSETKLPNKGETTADKNKTVANHRQVVEAQDENSRRPSLLSKGPKTTPKNKPKLDPSAIKAISGRKKEKAVASIPERRGNYIFPPLELLAEAPDANNLSKEDHAGTMQALVRILEEFGVKVIPGEIHAGPVITRYEVVLAPGVRLEEIGSLSDQISARLQAGLIKVSSLLPQKEAVGVYVANKSPQTMVIRDILESKAWAESRAELPIILGKDNVGKPIVYDLDKLGHLLVAGASGAGKTNYVQSIIAGLLYHSGPDDVRILLFDSKILEYAACNALPHMLIPVVSESAKVPGALKWLIAEMECRYQIFAKTNVRNIASFNAKINKDKEEQAKAEAMYADMSPEEWASVQQIEVPSDDDAFEIPKKKLARIVCFIDDLADFYWQDKKEIEPCLEKLLRLAANVGIHLIVSMDSAAESELSPSVRQKLQAKMRMIYTPAASLGVINYEGAFRFSPHGQMPNTSGRGESGHVYVMRNNSLPENCYKIGLTRESPQKRASELSSATGVPTEFEVVYSQETDDCRASEAAIHRELADFRVSKNREFFNCSLDVAIDAVNRNCQSMIATSIGVEGVAPYLSADEISAIVHFLQEKNDPPIFAQEVQRHTIGADSTYDHLDDIADELLPEAIDVLRSSKRASTSMLQRRLRIGYSRAARLMAELEENGIVGPENGSLPREILVDLDRI